MEGLAAGVYFAGWGSETGQTAPLPVTSSGRDYLTYGPSVWSIISFLHCIVMRLEGQGQ